MSVRCYWLEPTRKTRLYLRRYSVGPAVVCTGAGRNYHNAQIPFAEVGETYEFDQAAGTKFYKHEGPQEPSEIPDTLTWPEKCDACEYRFTDDDNRQVFSDRLYKRTDTGAIVTLGECGPGAMWNAEYLNDNEAMTGPDGMSITVICPNGRHWHVDGPCSNCTKKDDMVHKCWCRHGIPPQITVDKNCNSCSAGAGSIQAGDYHGFLRDGQFT